MKGKAFLGKGWKFPIQLDETGRIALSQFEEDIEESIRLILLTALGERTMRPAFGSGLHDFVFETMSASNLGLLQTILQDALIEWEPRIELITLDVKPGQGEKGRLLLDIDYRVRATHTKLNLVLPFYTDKG